MITLATVAATVLVGLPQTTLSESPTKLRSTATSIVRRFMERSHSYANRAPIVIVQFDPTISSYYLKDNTLRTTAWSQCPPELKEFVGTWAGYTKGKMSDEVLFRELFSWFLIPHEMGHFLQGQQGKLTPKADILAQEYWANRVAIAFWQGEKGQTPRLTRLMQAFDSIYANLKSPVPAGEDSKAYFQAHYEELTQDPNAYGWYQLDLIRKAWKNRKGTTLESLMSEM